MALTTLHWFSPLLGKGTTTQVILPDAGKPPFATLYLLHGASDDSTTWLRKTRLEHYVRALPLIVVMPDGYRGYYTNNPAGPAYARHIGEELPAMIERTFHAHAERSARAIGGLSMGGYGALRVGLDYADRFCSIHAHSAAVWSARHYHAHAKAAGPAQEKMRRDEAQRNFGGLPMRGEHSILSHARRAREAKNLPAILMDCGTEDFLLEDNRATHAALTKVRVPHLYREFPGAHDWDYWDLRIREALEFHAGNLGLGAGGH
jgi:S-formylglutathione hydrolase FrmB